MSTAKPAEAAPLSDEQVRSGTHGRPSRAEAEEAVRTLIRWAGDDADREGLRQTPQRVVRAFEEFFAGYNQDPVEILQRTFEETDGYDEVVALRGVRIESYCEHHMVPIIGKAHVAYLPGHRVVGISKLARVVDAFAKRLQIPGEIDRPDRQCDRRRLATQGRRGGDRGGTSVHDHTRRSQGRRQHGHQSDAGRISPQSDLAP